MHCYSPVSLWVPLGPRIRLCCFCGPSNHFIARQSTLTDVDLERKLLELSLASCELDDDTLHQLADVISDKWASIAPLLSFTTTEIEQIRSEDCPAQAMLQKLQEKGILTHEQLHNRLQTISVLNPTL